MDDPDRRCYRLIDLDDGETVAMVLRHEALENGQVVHRSDDGEGISARGKVFIFRDFWKSGRYQEEWDKVVLLSGLAVLEKGDRE